MSDQDKDVGKLLLTLDFHGTGCSPCIKVVLPAETDVQKTCEAITLGINGVLHAHLGEFELSMAHDLIRVEPHGATGIIKPWEEQKKIYDKQWEDLQEIFNGTEEQQEAEQKAIDEHPMNGKLGWWKVTGIRHECWVKASSCQEALDKSEDHVGSWESAKADWIGEELPDVFS